jgi:N-acylneuraminate cytidylyltransferase
VLGLIPARGGSKGHPGKNIRPLAGTPLIVHSIKCARGAARLTRTIVSTDSPEIAQVARESGADVPFMRPAALATDNAAMWGVVQHALAAIEAAEQREFDAVVLLDPTNPFRTATDIDHAIETLAADPNCDGVVGVVEPEANPLWHSVVERDDGYLGDLVEGAGSYTTRQAVPPVYSINGALYVWRRSTVVGATNWRQGRLKKQLVEDVPFTPIDSVQQFDALEALLRADIVSLPHTSDRP